MSYVVRPSSSASDACTSELICSPASASQNGRSQPAYSKSPSCSVGPPLAWITQSSVMFMLTCSSPIAPSPHQSRCVRSDHLHGQHRPDDNGSVHVAHEEDDDLEGSGPAHCSCRQRLFSTA